MEAFRKTLIIICLLLSCVETSVASIKKIGVATAIGITSLGVWRYLKHKEVALEKRVKSLKEGEYREGNEENVRRLEKNLTYYKWGRKGLLLLSGFSGAYVLFEGGSMLFNSGDKKRKIPIEKKKDKGNEYQSELERFDVKKIEETIERGETSVSIDFDNNKINLTEPTNSETLFLSECDNKGDYLGYGNVIIPSGVAKCFCKKGKGFVIGVAYVGGRGEDDEKLEINVRYSPKCRVSQTIFGEDCGKIFSNIFNDNRLKKAASERTMEETVEKTFEECSDTGYGDFWSKFLENIVCKERRGENGNGGVSVKDLVYWLKKLLTLSTKHEGHFYHSNGFEKV